VRPVSEDARHSRCTRFQRASGGNIGIYALDGRIWVAECDSLRTARTALDLD
jgi:hypothetical protein